MLNLEQASNRNNGDQYVSEAFNAASYTVQNITPEYRKKALEKVKKVAFPQLFEPVSPHIKGAPRLTGFAWKDSKPAPGPGGGGITVINERVKDVNLFGIAPNGTTAISYLSGKVREADTANGKVIISTKFFLQVCDTQDTKKCFSRQIRQETTGLSNVKVKANDVLEISQEIGSSTADKPEFTRFFIEGFKNELVTLNPQIVWGWAVPEEGLIDTTPKTAPTSGNPQAPAPTPAPAPGSSVIGKVGSTGSSSGPHLHAEWADQRAITVEQVREFVKVPGTVTSTYNDPSRSRHKGVDIGGNNGAPIELINGTSVARVVETKCTIENSRYNDCGGGLGNHVIINTPKGQMTLAHLAPQSIPPDIAGLRSTSGGGKGSPNMQAAPATQGLTLETGFKGVPRTLRIIPGRTILSLISDYDSWVENGGPRGDDNSTDPGIWIPSRFKNWFITQCKYKWRDGDLRVDLEGRSAWGTRDIKVPTFPNYLASMKGAGELKNTTDYYGYIRSLGDLHWKMEGTGKDSTEELCGEAQYWSQAAAEGPDTTTPTNTQGSFPAANCRTGNATKDEVINALYSVGIKTPNAFAGVLGNFQAESAVQANRHNLARPGSGCSSTSGGPLGSTGYGIAQWCGSRQTNIFNRCGRVSNLSCELQFMVSEIRGKRDTDPNLVANMNAASSPSAAADAWNAGFERGPGGIQERRDAAVANFSQIKCNKSTP